MIQQPELGKKIVNYRKMKGLTQEALVDKCNINVRTLQRIESGEVMPRIQTVKLIFEALEINYENTITSNTVDNSELISKKLNPILDLFNFKTNAMKKIVILSVICIALLSFFYINKFYTTQQLKEKQTSLTKLNQKFTEYYNTGKLDSLESLFLENAWYMPKDQKAIHGKTEIIKDYKLLHKRGIRLLEAKTNFTAVSDSIAVDRGNWLLVHEEFSYPLFYVRQWRFYNGKWYIENVMTNSITIY